MPNTGRFSRLFTNQSINKALNRYLCSSNCQTVRFNCGLLMEFIIQNGLNANRRVNELFRVHAWGVRYDVFVHFISSRHSHIAHYSFIHFFVRRQCNFIVHLGLYSLNAENGTAFQWNTKIAWRVPAFIFCSLHISDKHNPQQST